MWEFSPPPPNVKKPCKAHTPEGGLRQKDALGREDCPDCKHVESGLYPHAMFIHGSQAHGRDGIRKRLQWFDMVLGYDEVSLSAFTPFMSPKVYGGVLQGGYDSRLWKPIERDWHSERFQFLMHGALGNRKAPWTTIEAWHKLKAEKGDAFAGARLALHTSAPGVLFKELNEPFEHVGAKVFVGTIPALELKNLYAASHCLLAPSRGEGKNLPALEFMTTGGAVAATNYGGHRQWISGDWAYPLDYTLTPSFEDCPWGAHDAKVSVDHLAETIWHIYTHREEARQKAMRAQELIPKMCDWSVVVENLFRRIRDAVPSNNVGPQVYDKAMACRRTSEELTLPQLVAGPDFMSR
jgi:glycosyltransferase involved in cell wall biosynthesis